jgi:hypothetical protein
MLFSIQFTTHGDSDSESQLETTCTKDNLRDGVAVACDEAVLIFYWQLINWSSGGGGGTQEERSNNSTCDNHLSRMK